MGTKRGASPLLSGTEEKENKKLNMEHGSGKPEEYVDPNAVHDDTFKEQQVGQHGQHGSQHGDHDRGVGEDMELTKIKADLKRLKTITMKQREEIREGITAITNKLGEMFIAHAATATSANFYGDFMEELSSKLTDAELREVVRDKRIDGIVLTNQKTVAKVGTMEREVNENTQERKSGNLVLNGVPEKENEDCLVTATTYLTHIDPKFEKNLLLNAYRLGKKGGSASRYRTLLVKFKDVAVKEEIVKKKAVLKNKKELAKFHCNEDLPPAVRKVRQEMRQIARYAQKK